MQMSRIAIALMRWCFLAAMVVLAVTVVTRGQWEGRLITEEQYTYIVTLPESPIWHPPAMPPFQLFADSFDDIPGAYQGSFKILLVFRWDLAAINFLIGLWPISAFFGIVYLGIRMDSGAFDYLLHYGSYLAGGLTCGASACVGSYLVWGGWGLPSPIPFAVCGITLGVVLGTYQSPWFDRICERIADAIEKSDRFGHRKT